MTMTVIDECQHCCLPWEIVYTESESGIRFLTGFCAYAVQN